MKEEKILIAKAEDKLRLCEDGYMVTRTGFLSMTERSLLAKSLPPTFATKTFFGGYEDAERVILGFLPDYAGEEDLKAELAVIRATKKPGARQLTHRDYLGSLLGLGIDRSVIGDILVREDGADIICLEEMADFLMDHYFAAGRTELSLEKLELDQLMVPEAAFKEMTDTLASLRLDNVVSSAFRISRSKALEAIKRGIVFVNSLEVTKADKQIKEGDKIVLRGKGKVILSEINGKSRKDRTYVVFKVYI